LVADLHDLFGLQLAEGPAGLIGTSNPRVVVAVNFLGQYFYDNRRIGEEELKKELKRCLRDAARESKELDLLVWADKDVDFNAVSRLERLADEVGIKRAWQVERSQSSAAVSAKPTP
jgi:biopolymer transport protein ExbD